jgi:hypothetical protein
MRAEFGTFRALVRIEWLQKTLRFRKFFSPTCNVTQTVGEKAHLMFAAVAGALSHTYNLIGKINLQERSNSYAHLRV